MKNKLVCIGAVLLGINVEYLGIYVDTHFEGIIAGICIILMFYALNMQKKKNTWGIIALIEAILLGSPSAKPQMFAASVITVFSIYT